MYVRFTGRSDHFRVSLAHSLSWPLIPLPFYFSLPTALSFASLCLLNPPPCRIHAPLADFASGAFCASHLPPPADARLSTVRVALPVRSVCSKCHSSLCCWSSSLLHHTLHSTCPPVRQSVLSHVPPLCHFMYSIHTQHCVPI